MICKIFVRTRLWNIYLQDGLLVEFLEILNESDVPIFSNMTADNLPDDNMVSEENAQMLCISFWKSAEFFFSWSQIHKDADVFLMEACLINLVFRQSVATSVPAYHFYLGPAALSGHLTFQICFHGVKLNCWLNIMQGEYGNNWIPPSHWPAQREVCDSCHQNLSFINPYFSSHYLQLLIDSFILIQIFNNCDIFWTSGDSQARRVARHKNEVKQD